MFKLATLLLAMLGLLTVGTCTAEKLDINTKVSLAHLGSLDSFEISEPGTQAGKFMLDYLEKHDEEALKIALSIYKRLIPVENYGGEYSALEWFGEYFQANETTKKEMLADPYVKSFYELFAKDDFATLKEYIKTKYKLSESKSPLDRVRWLEDFILFNNPKREEWEATTKTIEVLNIKEGDSVVDVGSGPGYYTFKFSKIVGDKGRVFAIDTVKTHLDYIKEQMVKNDVKNIELVNTRANTIGLPSNVADLVFICSLYHVIYMTDTEDVKDAWIASIKKSLKPDGSLVVVDNAIAKEGKNMPYHGPHIAKELIIAQLQHYGFKLVDQYSFVPQRYILRFKLAKTPSS